MILHLAAGDRQQLVLQARAQLLHVWSRFSEVKPDR
jgi:hypothetical protein